MANQARRRQWVFTLTYLFWAAVAVWWFHSAAASAKPQEVSYSEFVKELKGGRFQSVRITDTQLTGEVKQQSKNKKVPPQEVFCSRIPGLSADPIVQELESQNISFSGNITKPSWFLTMLVTWGPLILLFGVWGALMWRMQRRGGALSFGRNRAKIHDSSNRFDTKFTDVAGVAEAKAELAEIIDFLRDPQKYQRLGGRMPRGILLVGPPGTGKTLLAQAVAGEANVPFFSISGSEFVEMFVGVGASRVRDLFEQAKLRSPCIIFIDELDAIGKSRAAAHSLVSNDEREQTLNQLLVEMDGFDTSKAVIIMAATNRPEVLDPALLRPGRFDRQIVLDRPDLTEREAILRVHARKLRVGTDVDLHNVAAETPGMVGADLANIVNEAALNAARRNADQIKQVDFEQAVDRVVLGFERKGRLISADEKERVATHEVGHAVVALSVPHADDVRRVSIVPRSIGALGHTLQLPTKDRYLLTEPELEDRITVMLGGRAAEDLVYGGVVSTGASDDLERASALARQMVTHYGMSKNLGELTYGISNESLYLKTPFGLDEKNYSERTAEQIDQDVRQLTDELYARAKRILSEHQPGVHAVVAALLRKETLERDELHYLLESAKFSAETQPQGTTSTVNKPVPS